MRISRRVPTPRSPTPAALRWQQHSIRTHHRRRKSDRLPPDRDRSHRQKTCFQPHRPRQVPAFPAAPEDREPAARTSPARRRRRTQKQVASIVQRPWTEFITDAHSGLLERQKSTAPTRRTANNTTQTRRTTGKHRAESLGGANKNAANSANASRKHRTHDRKRQAPDRFRATRYRAPHPAIGRCECTHDRPHKFTATARPRPAQPPKRGKFRHRKGPDPRPGPDAHALGRLP